MITPDSILRLARKHGALGVMALWLSYTTYRLDAVESKLYGCFDELKQRPMVEKKTDRFVNLERFYAVMPSKSKIKINKETIIIS
jgi:hypothetical protein